MSRDRASLLDIINAANRILKFAEQANQATLANDEEKQSAILYQVIVMGEATKRLSDEFRALYPEVPWKDMAGMRDILAHQYDRVNLKTLWDVVQNDIPELITLLTAIQGRRDD